MRQRAQLIAHIQNTNSQYNLPIFDKKLTYKGNRTAEIAERFEHPSTQLSIGADLALIENYDVQIAKLELHLTKSAKVDDPTTYQLLRTVPGIGPILGLVILYEIDDVKRFAEVGNFLSYSRLVACTHESADKVKGVGGRKTGDDFARQSRSGIRPTRRQGVHESMRTYNQQHSFNCGVDLHARSQIGRAHV